MLISNVALTTLRMCGLRFFGESVPVVALTHTNTHIYIRTHSCRVVCVRFLIFCVSLKPLVPVRPSPSGEKSWVAVIYMCVACVCTQLSIATRPVANVCFLALGKSYTLSDF